MMKNCLPMDSVLTSVEVWHCFFQEISLKYYLTFSDIYTAKLFCCIFIYEKLCMPQNCVFKNETYFSATFIFNGLSGAVCGTIHQKGSTGKSEIQQYAKAT